MAWRDRDQRITVAQCDGQCPGGYRRVLDVAPWRQAWSCATFVVYSPVTICPVTQACSAECDHSEDTAMTAIVQEAVLTYRQGQQDVQLAVDSAGWFAWLETASSFAFMGAAGRFTARKERDGGAGGYWHAARTQAGQVR